MTRGRRVWNQRPVPSNGALPILWQGDLRMQKALLVTRRDVLKHGAALGACASWISVGASPAEAASAAADSRPRHVGTTRQLFLDNWIVERISGLKRTLHPPQKKGLIQEADGRPWERGCVSSVVRDARGRFHMTYRVFWFDAAALQRKKHFPAEGFRSLIGYAVSDDGIRWRRPVLGLVEGPTGFRRAPESMWPKGIFSLPTGFSKQNNFGYPIAAIRDVGQFGGVSDPKRRYLMFSGGIRFGAEVPDVVADPDWRGKVILIPGARGPRGGIIGWDEQAKLWLAIGQSGGWQGSAQGRVIARWTSKDLKSWSGQEIVLPIAADESRKPDDSVEYYYMDGYRVGDAWLGLLIVYRTDRSSREYEHPTLRNTWMKGTTEIRLMVSRDAGRSWQRVAGKQPWLPHHEEEDGYDRTLYTGGPPVRVGDELWLYYRGDDGDHITFRKDNTPYYKDRTRISRTARAVLRWDGYLSLRAADGAGAMTTKPLVTSGRKLAVNAAVRVATGSVRVEVQDASGKPLAGYALADCAPLRGDGVAQSVRWKGGAQLPRATKDRPLRLRFEVRDADLYGFQMLD